MPTWVSPIGARAGVTVWQSATVNSARRPDKRQWLAGGHYPARLAAGVTVALLLLRRVWPLTGRLRQRPSTGRRGEPPATRRAGARDPSHTRSASAEPISGQEPKQAPDASTRPKRDWAAIATIAALALAGVPGLAALIALIFTYQQVHATNVQLQIAEQGQITDRYNAAITNLGSRSIEIQLGGIYALQRLMQDSPRDQPTVVAVLCAFVRDQTAPAVKPQKLPTSQVPTDIQAALTVVGTRNTANDGSATVVDLDHARLAGAQLWYMHLNDADFSSANLSGATFQKSGLHDALFDNADLTNAHFGEAKLTNASLQDANLTGANVALANLRGAFLAGAKLTNASFDSSNLGGAVLEGADLTGADLEGANLTDAVLEYANLTGAYLSGATFTGADLAHATWPKDAKAPKGWVRNPHSGRLTSANAGT